MSQSTTPGILEYIETLDNYDEKNPVIRAFAEKINKPIEYRSILNEFDWKSNHCTALDEKLIELGYAGHDKDIKVIKNSLIDKIKKMSLVKFNLLFKADLWDHMELFEKEPNLIYWEFLSRNPAAIKVLAQNIDELRYKNLAKNPGASGLIISQLGRNVYPEERMKYLSQNPSMIKYLKEHPDRIDWYYLCRNPAAIDMIEAYIEECINKKQEIWDKIAWDMLSMNPAAIPLLKRYPEKINWECLSMNPAAIPLLKTNPNRIDWSNLSSNPAAYDLIKQHMMDCTRDGIAFNLHFIALSRNPAAISILERIIERDNEYRSRDDPLNWDELSCNPAAMHLLRKYPEKINWLYLSINPYNINQAKLDHINSLKLFPRSQLELFDPDALNYNDIFLNLTMFDD